MHAGYRLNSCLWELTLKCNLRCMHCGSGAGLSRNKELTLDECFRIAQEIYQLGCEELTFIGGEIFLYPGWQEVARFLSGQGIRVNLMSNGYCIGKKEAQEIRYAALTNIGISIDGMEETHNRIRGKKNSFQQIKKAFDTLNEAGIPIGAVTCLLDFNVSDLEDLYEYLVENNVKLWQLQLVNPMGRMADKKDLIIRPEKIPSITRFVREKNKERQMVVLAADSIGYYDDNELYIRGRRSTVCYWEGCQAGISSLCIDSVGNVKGCGALYSEVFIEGNVREQSLSEIWNDKDKFGYNRKFNVSLLQGKCAGCDVGDICRGGCRASNYFAANNLYENRFCSHCSSPGKRSASKPSH